MQLSVFSPLLLVALILQTTTLDAVSVAGVIPDLVLLLVVLNGFLLGPREGAFLGFAGGIVEDFFSGGYIGLNALSKMAAGYLAGIAGERLNRENITVATGVTFFSSLGGLIVNYLLLVYINVHIPPLYALFGVALPTAVYTAVITPLFFWRFFRLVQLRNRDL